ncbi:hypothetical protein DA120_00590 [Aeromonas sp. w55]
MKTESENQEVQFRVFSGKTDKDFLCQEGSLNEHYHKRLKKQAKLKLFAAYEAVNNRGEVVAYATMSGCSVDRNALGNFGEKLPYQKVPFTLIGRFAVDIDFGGLGIGKAFMAYLISKARDVAEQVGSLGIFVDAVPSAIGFYEKLGFVKCEAEEKEERATTPMFLPFPRNK